MMLYDKIKELNSTAYLTLMSIVQGVALSFFAEAVINGYRDYSLLSWLMTLGTLFVLILTWFEYLKGITMFVWFHGIFDSCIPFGLFLSEIILVQTMNEKGGWWFWGMLLFCLLSLLAFLNQFLKAGKETENADIIIFIGKRMFRPIWFCLLSAVIFLLFWMERSDNNEVIFAIISLVMISVFSLLSATDWARVIEYARYVKNEQCSNKGSGHNLQ